MPDRRRPDLCLRAASLAALFACQAEQTPPKPDSTPAAPLPARAEQPEQPTAFEVELFAADVPLTTMPLSLGIEGLGGISVTLLPKAGALPAERSEVFTTASANQDSIELHLILGDHSRAMDNRSVAKLGVRGIPPAQAGVPLVEIRLAVDARGRLSVSAHDQATRSPLELTEIGEVSPPASAADVVALQAQPTAPLDPAAKPTALPLFDDEVLNDGLPLSIGLETMHGESTVLFPRGTALPAQRREVFTTAQDNQPSVEIRLVMGERALAADNRTLGVFQLYGIPPAPRGIPQIEVTLSIDGEGVLSAEAVDLGTGGRRGVTISGGDPQLGLSKAEVERLLAEAEAARVEDDAIRAKLAAILRLEALVSGAQGLTTSAAKLDPGTLAAVKEAAREAQSLLDDDPKQAKLNDLEGAYEALERASHRASRELYGR